MKSIKNKFLLLGVLIIVVVGIYYGVRMYNTNRYRDIIGFGIDNIFDIKETSETSFVGSTTYTTMKYDNFSEHDLPNNYKRLPIREKNNRRFFYNNKELNTFYKNGFYSLSTDNNSSFTLVIIRTDVKEIIIYKVI